MSNRLIVLVCLFLMGGCATAPLNHDIIPSGYENQFIQARAQAVDWYQGRYHAVPKVPCIQLVIEDNPMNGEAGGCPNSHYIWIWKGQLDSLQHEVRHALCLENGLGGTEGAVQ